MSSPDGAGSDLLRLTGMYIKKSKSGKTYMGGDLNASLKIMMFKNENKRGEKDPDYILYLGKKETRQASPPQENDPDIPF